MRSDVREGRTSAAGAAVHVGQNSAVKLAEAVSQLLADPAARERMGRVGEERIRTPLNLERSVEQRLQVDETALAQQPYRGWLLMR